MSLVSAILTDVGYNIGTTIDTSSEPAQTDCIAWINQTNQWILAECAEHKSEIGRTLGSITTIKATITDISQDSPGDVTSATHGVVADEIILIKGVAGMTDVNDTWYTATVPDANSITIGVDTSGYDAWSSGGYVYKKSYTLSATLYTPYEFGWIEKTYSRAKIKLTTEEKSIDYNPVGIGEPDKFYIDADANTVSFLPVPNAALTIKIPYWAIPTALTATTETIPFNAIFDNLITEAVTIKAQNRNEYDLGFELKWMSFIKEKAKRVIEMRKNINVEVGV